MLDSCVHLLKLRTFYNIDDIGAGDTLTGAAYTELEPTGCCGTPTGGSEPPVVIPGLPAAECARRCYLAASCVGYQVATIAGENECWHHSDRTIFNLPTDNATDPTCRCYEGRRFSRADASGTAVHSVCCDVSRLEPRTQPRSCLSFWIAAVRCALQSVVLLIVMCSGLWFARIGPAPGDLLRDVLRDCMHADLVTDPQHGLPKRGAEPAAHALSDESTSGLLPVRLGPRVRDVHDR